MSVPSKAHTIIIALAFFLSAESLHSQVTASRMFTAAIASGDLVTMDTLLSSGLDPNQPDRSGRTPLYVALLSNQPKVVDLLLSRRANPNAPLNTSRFSSSPLEYALQYGNLQTASRLIAAGAHVDAKDHGGRTPVHITVASRHLDLLTFLIDKGADVNARDAEGTSPLDDAVWHGSLDAAAILLAHGARLNEPHSQTGATPINEAAFRGNTSVLRYLLQFHPDLETADNHGYTPLENATRMKKEESALLLLEAEPARPQTPPFLAKAFETAIRKDESLVTAAFLHHGFDANNPMPSGATPLEVAASSGATATLRTLLENGADPNINGRNGSTPLEEASLRGFDAIVTSLLDHGAHVNALNISSGTTALYAAASFGKAGVVKILLDHSADSALCGSNRKTPYQAALENGFGELASQIRDRKGAVACPR